MGGAPLAIVVREAHPGDRETIVRFNADLARESEGKALDFATLHPGVAAALADPDRLRYWVAEIDGRIIGQAAVTREWSDWRNGWIWWFQSVYVAPEYRAQGVFKALHRHIRGAAHAAADVVGLRLYVDDANERAQRTYHALGLRPGGYHVLEEFWPRGAGPA